MLADTSPAAMRSGSLDREIHQTRASYDHLLDFVAAELPRWRDFPGRKHESSEQRLTDQLCDHLNSAARKSDAWSFVQFRTEVPDEIARGRTIDLVIKPCAALVWIDGRCHNQFDPLIPIECKRLPTPRDADRDEREYVVSGQSTAGGIQRFKLGLHGAAHHLAAMIGYVQSEAPSVWGDRIAGWIVDLSSHDPAWSPGERLLMTADDPVYRICRWRSTHKRRTGLQDIELKHLWIVMTVDGAKK